MVSSRCFVLIKQSDSPSHNILILINVKLSLVYTSLYECVTTDSIVLCIILAVIAWNSRTFCTQSPKTDFKTCEVTR